MIGIVYLKENNKIIGIVPDVQSYTETDIIGTGDSVKGLDLTKASFCIVESTNLQVGDTLGTFTDIRQQVPPNKEERIAALESAIMSLMGL